MKNFWRRMAAREGFTLVELVVVIAILAILAAVAYPAYTGYIKKAQEATDLQALSSISTACQGLAAGAQETLTEIKVFATGGTVNKVTTTPSISEDNIKALLGGATYSITFKSDTYKGGATWSSTGGTGSTGQWNPGATE